MGHPFERLLIVTLATPLVVAACRAETAERRAVADSASVRTAIEAVNERWREAYLAGTLAAAAPHVFAEDAIRIGAGREPVVGLQAIVERLRANPVQVDSADFQLVELQTSGNLAFTRERYTIKAGEESFSGRSFVLWRRQPDGGWKIQRIMFD